jgi:phosphonopyruvate decarboxylase
MLSRKEALLEIYNTHGDEAIYVTTTGFISRAMYDIFPNNKNVFYMKGSMGLASAITLGISEFSNKQVVAINGDGAHLMHLGLTHTIKERNRENLFVYILDNGCHESVGGQKCSPLKEEYYGVNKIYKISCDGKTPRVKKGFIENAKEIADLLKINK